ncbi:MAG: peptidylprolyl isomerase [Pseudomonadota bacterium]|nr:peptidylprolyl isomerase [Pseudomonadota bacterium]
MIILETNMGEIQINVDAEKAPITARNFIDYVEEGFFDGTIFHRVIPNFMIQGGGMTEDMNQKTTKATIENEAKNGLKNVKYSVAMARTMAPHSASSQFFINTNDNQFLDFPGQDGWGYCVFGEVVSGQEVIDKIEKVETINLGSHADVPEEAVIIKKASIKN